MASSALRGVLTLVRRLNVSALLLVLVSCSGGDAYPNRPIVLVCPWAVGGGSDRVARQTAALLERELGTPVNVLNQTGGEGVTGHSEGARATPDGYTLTLMTVEINMLHWRGLTALSYKNFDPVMLINRDPAAVFVRADAPWASLGDLRARVEAGPAKLRGSGTASGGIWHLALGGWLAKIGRSPADVNWIPSQGSAPSLQELIGGGLDLVACSLPEGKPLLDAGKVRCLGVMALDRLAAFPDVPTFREQGVDWSIGAWRGIGAPRGTPRGVIDRLVDVLGKVAASEAFLAPLRAAGHGTAAEKPPEFARTLATTDASMGELLNRPEFRTLTTSRVSPYVFPAALATVLALALAWLGFTKGFRVSEPAAPLAWGRLAEGVGWIALYIALSNALGFLLTAGGLLLALLLRLRVRWPVALAVSAFLVPAVYAVFALKLHVPLPRGPW
jgi:tripartite-type tricarboxylate transporter receptor subunit TctC